MQTQDEIERLFNNLKPTAFAPETDAGQVSYERQAGGGEIQPTGWVVNKDANVTIDEKGITILDGKLFLEDYGGSSVLGPAGFDGSWVEFVNGGVYNGGFNAGISTWVVEGVTGYGAVLKATTIVGGALTSANYVASLSAAIPYWISTVHSAALTSQIRADSTYGRYLAIERPTNGLGGNAPGGTAKFMQDMPVVQGHPYEMYLKFGMVSGGVPLVNSEIHVWRAWHDSDHDQIVAPADIKGFYYTPGIGVDPSGAYTFDAGTPPEGAKYARVFLEFIHADNPTGGGTVWQVYDVRLRPTTTGARLLLSGGGSQYITPVIFDQPSQGSVRIILPETPSGWGNFEILNMGNARSSVFLDSAANGGRIMLADGVALPDVKLFRSAANVLSLGAGDRLGMDGWVQQLGVARLAAEKFLTNTGTLTLVAGTDKEIHRADFKVTYPSNPAMTGKKVVVRVYLDASVSFSGVGEYNIAIFADTSPDNHSSTRLTFTKRRADTAGLGSVWWDGISETIAIFDANSTREFYAQVRHSASVSCSVYGHGTADYVSRIGYQVIGYY